MTPKSYIPGGYSNGGIFETEIHNVIQNTFTQGQDLPNPSYGHCPLKMESTGTVLLIGGSQGPILNTITAYNIATGLITAWSPMLSARVGPICALLNNEEKILVGGGAGPGWVNTRSVEVLDVATGSWTVKQDVPYDVRTNAQYFLNGDLYIYQSTSSDPHYIFDTENNSWQPIPGRIYPVNSDKSPVVIDSEKLTSCN
jgi:hypothetical protein